MNRKDLCSFAAYGGGLFVVGLGAGAAAFEDNWTYGIGLGVILGLGGLMIKVGDKGTDRSQRRHFNLILASLHISSLGVFAYLIADSGVDDYYTTVQTSNWQVYNATCQGNTLRPIDPVCISTDPQVRCRTDGFKCSIQLKTEHAGTVSIEWLVFAFHAMSALHHALLWAFETKQKYVKTCFIADLVYVVINVIAYVAGSRDAIAFLIAFLAYTWVLTLFALLYSQIRDNPGWYENQLAKNRQPLRWLEYAFSAPLQQVCFLILTGVIGKSHNSCLSCIEDVG